MKDFWEGSVLQEFTTEEVGGRVERIQDCKRRDIWKERWGRKIP